MKPGSQFVLLVLIAVGMKDAKRLTVDQIREKLTTEMITEDAVAILKEEMTLHADLTYAELCEFADETGEPVYFNSKHPYWAEAGFDEFTKEARIVFRRMQEHFGREMCFTKDSMVVFPHNRVLKERVA